MLHLGSSNITAITPLSGLTSLTTLYLDDNPLSDLTPLSGLVNLKGLYLTYNQISDLAPLSGLAGLESLSLYQNQISDITPLGSLAPSSVNVSYNMLDLTPDSPSMQTIEAWQSGGTTVTYQPQLSGAIVGTVSALGRGPLGSVTISVASDGATTTSSSSGSYTLSGVASGDTDDHVLQAVLQQRHDYVHRDQERPPSRSTPRSLQRSSR